MAIRTNPDPARITPEMWRFWLAVQALIARVLLGGVFADKPGYHNYRLRLPVRDYSVGGQVRADRDGDPSKSSAIDLTMPDAAMRLLTGRLWEAAEKHDPRFFIAGHPILREFIGTLDSRSVVCWVFIGGEQLGMRRASGSDPGRDRTHLWHIHLSIIRRFVGVWQAYDQLLSILAGESLEAWRRRTAAPVAVASKGDDDVSWNEPEIQNPDWRDPKKTPKVTPKFALYAAWVEAHAAAERGAAIVTELAHQRGLLAAIAEGQAGGTEAVAAVHHAVESMRMEVTQAVVAQFGAAMPALVAHLVDELGDALDEVTQERIEAAAATAQAELLDRLRAAFGLGSAQMPDGPAQLEAPASGS